MKLGVQAAIREQIVIDVMLNYVNDDRKSDNKIFSLRDVKQRVNLYESDIEVALSDLREMRVIEVAPGYSQTSDPYYQFTKSWLENRTTKISTAWIPGQGWWKQRSLGNYRSEKGAVMWYGGHPNLHCKHYKIT